MLASSRETQRGQVLVIVAGGLVAMMLAVGLVIDGGNAFFQRRAAQNAADLSAMAGTQVIGDNLLQMGRTGTSTVTSATVYKAVQDARDLNACPTSDTTCTFAATYVDYNRAPIGAVSNNLGAVPSSARGVRVTTSRNFSTYFLGIIGQPRWDAGAAATALALQSTTVERGILLPIAMLPYNPDLVAGDSIDITSDSGQQNGPGNFGWLDWFPDSSSQDELADSVCVSDNDEMTLPAQVIGNPGRQNGSTLVGCMNDYIANQSTVLIPVWSVVQDQGSNFEYTITGYVAVKLVSYEHQAITRLKAEVVNFINPTGKLPSGASVLQNGYSTTPVFFGLVE